MSSLKIYQIGVGSFGRFGFEKLVEMHNHLEEIDVELKGVCEKDFDKLEAAEKFAEANGIDIETFHDPDEMYDAASREEGEIVIYDAGPADTHSRHIQRSLQNGFYHLTEKPPSMTREEHLTEKKLSERSDVFYKVDFIECESPVVKKTIELLEDNEIDSIKVFRESSIGAQKVLQPVERRGVKGGDILDKMVHEVYVLDLLEAARIEPELELEEAHSDFFMPKKLGSEKLMAVDGGVKRGIDPMTATGQTHAKFSAGDVDVELHSSWLGLSEEAEKFEESMDLHLVERGYRSSEDGVFMDEDARFFIIEGERNLLGDLLHGKLYDLDREEEIGVPDLMHDQLYRVIEKAVTSFAKEESQAGDKEADLFVNSVFDVKDRVVENTGGFMDELEKSNERLRKLMVEDFEVGERATA